MSTHFTAVIKIYKKTKQDGKKDQYNRVIEEKIDESAEIASVIVRADSLSLLVDKARKHLDLISE